MLTQLDTDQDAFQELAKDFGAVMQLVGYFYSEYPGLHFGRDIIKGLARYSLEVDFDFYSLYSYAREDTA